MAAEVTDALAGVERQVDNYESVIRSLKRAGRLPRNPADRDAVVERREEIKANFIHNKKRCRVAIQKLNPRKQV